METFKVKKMIEKKNKMKEKDRKVQGKKTGCKFLAGMREECET